MVTTPIPQDRLVRKEVALGVLHEFELPQEHIGLTLFAPFQDVQSDDVIFNYTRGLTVGMAPARAEDAESEMAGKDDSVGFGRASLIDWAIKDHYDASDITRFREAMILGGLAGAENLSLVTKSITEDWSNKLARDTARRKRQLDNRMEWLIMSAMDTGVISYNDGRILFTCDFGRPSAQQDFLPPSTGNHYWDQTTADPIEDMLTIKADARINKGVNLNRAVMSTRVYRTLRKSQKFVDALTGSNPLYKVTGWGDKAAADFIANQVEMEIIVYDSVYRTRSLGSNTVVNTRFMRDNGVLFIPSDADVASLDDAIGFGKTLTSPHPEGNWGSGFYEWERSTVDPWGYDIGTGIKAFPVIPHMDMSYLMTALAP